MDITLNHRIIDVEELIPNPKNPRIDLRPGMPLYEKLKNSLIHHEYVEPIVWNERTGYVVSGHQRLQVMKDIAEENGDPLEKVEVIVVDMPENVADTLMVALNQITGIWDEEKLSALFRELSEEDLSYTGFDDYEIKALIEGAQESTEGFDDGGEIERKPKNIEFGYVVEIICESEDEQQSVYERLTEEGYKCRLSM